MNFYPIIQKKNKTSYLLLFLKESKRAERVVRMTDNCSSVKFSNLSVSIPSARKRSSVMVLSVGAGVGVGVLGDTSLPKI